MEKQEDSQMEYGYGYAIIMERRGYDGEVGVNGVHIVREGEGRYGGRGGTV